MEHVKDFFQFINEFTNYWDMYDEEDANLINQYQQWSRSLNNSIASGNLNRKEREMVKFLDSAIKRSRNKTYKGQIVYRGISKNRLDVYKSSIGDIITYKPFLSTSNNPNVAGEFAGFGKWRGDVIEIKLKPNMPFIYLDSDDFYNEEELLFQRDLKFRVFADGESVKLAQV